MSKEQFLKDLESKLNVVNRGIFKAEAYPDSAFEDIQSLHQMVSSRQNLSPNEKTAIIEELSRLRK
ncbi:DUF1128 family protein [Aliicoccus persicus]|uniref:Uncharacterized protein YfkK, UPF0435 family n=1 Tax=Aliicoccus persicus TaxID=930138 RepID=A0A662Z7A6_9STAP|nr:DUF1128 family protein [Aliicoccus persicus]SEW12509.1 Uncharacterized protein YfkK, UPF0435 family [Aliicoccus persicus]